MQTNNVRLCQHFFEGSVLTGIADHVRILTSVECQNIQSKRLRDFGGRLSDPTKTDEAHRLSRKLDQRMLPETEVGAACPFSVFNGNIMVTNSVTHLQQQRKGKLRDSIGTVGRNVRYLDIQLFGTLDIDHVETRRQDTDVPNARHRAQDLSGQRSLVRVDNLCIADRFDDHAGTMIDSIEYCQIS